LLRDDARSFGHSFFAPRWSASQHAAVNVIFVISRCSTVSNDCPAGLARTVCELYNNKLVINNKHYHTRRRWFVNRLLCDYWSLSWHYLFWSTVSIKVNNVTARARYRCEIFDFSRNSNVCRPSNRRRRCHDVASKLFY